MESLARPADALEGLPRVIGLGGFARSGKDAVADSLSRFGYRRVAFADPLYEIVHDLDVTVRVKWSAGWRYRFRPYQRLNALVEEHGWHWVKAHAPAGRATLDALGAGVRGYDPDFWVRAAMRATDGEGRVVVTDCRFPAEADAVRAVDGVFVRVTRPGVGPGVNAATGKPSVYETSMADYRADFTVRNDREGLDALDESVACMLADASGGAVAVEDLAAVLGRSFSCALPSAA
jgi:hypothetical protein